MKNRWLNAGAGLLCLTLVLSVQASDRARGVVFHDANRNQVRDPGERGIPGVLVSNQREVVKTDAAGRWELPATDDSVFFVIKPGGWMTPVDAQQLPRFYYVHKPDGSPPLRFGGVAPTGPLPGSIDFPLVERPEPGRFQAVLFADTQARDQRELNYMAHTVIAELIGTPAAFGVTLGDILFDDLSLFDDHNALVAQIGIPWYNVIGNHDINFDAADDRHSDETFTRVYGPNYYSFAYGPVQFFVLDNIQWGGAAPAGTGRYTGGFGEDQLIFLENLLEHLPADRLLVFLMHIPIMQVQDRDRFYRLIENRPHTVSFSGHTHWQAHFLLGPNDGWRGPNPHHHVVNVTVSGSWWSGEPDELGIPHTLMGDGAPHGYSIVTFDGQQAVVDFKAARRPAAYQMNIHAPSTVPANADAEGVVQVNVFGGSERSTVEMRLGDRGEWVRLEKVFEEDPAFVELKRVEAESPALRGRKLTTAKKSHHLWKGTLPAGLTPGAHRIEVRTQDQYGRVFEATRILRVLP